jgi:hypothetical protein
LDAFARELLFSFVLSDSGKKKLIKDITTMIWSNRNNANMFSKSLEGLEQK